jgi:hypothetical protein
MEKKEILRLPIHPDSAGPNAFWPRPKELEHASEAELRAWYASLPFWKALKIPTAEPSDNQMIKNAIKKANAERIQMAQVGLDEAKATLSRYNPTSPQYSKAVNAVKNAESKLLSESKKAAASTINSNGNKKLQNFLRERREAAAQATALRAAETRAAQIIAAARSPRVPAKSIQPAGGNMDGGARLKRKTRKARKTRKTRKMY